MDPLTDDQRQLAERPKALGRTYAIANQWASRFPSYRDDIFSAALYGLVSAARRWNPGYQGPRKATFESFIVKFVVGEIKTMLRMSVPKGFRRTDNQAPITESISRLIDDVLEPESGEEEVGWALESEDLIRYLCKLAAPHRAETLFKYLTECDCVSVRRLAEKVGMSAAGLHSRLYMAVEDIQNAILQNPKVIPQCFTTSPSKATESDTLCNGQHRKRAGSNAASGGAGSPITGSTRKRAAGRPGRSSPEAS